MIPDGGNTVVRPQLKTGVLSEGPLTSVGTQASGESPLWVSWMHPQSPRTVPRTEPGAAGTE